MGNKTVKSAKLEGCAITYTQVVRHVQQDKTMNGNQHGINRDTVKVKLLSPTASVISVADGAGLLFWSEVASRVASQCFLEYWEKFNKENPSPTVELVRENMRESVIYVNKQFKNWIHPQTKEQVDILDLGGQTTLGGFYIWKLNDSDKKKYKSEWGGFCVGTGDSPSYHFSPDDGGAYTPMFKDYGQMLPFPGLEVHNIQEPTFQTAKIGDLFIGVSDGMTDSFIDRDLPKIPITEQQNSSTAANYLIQQNHMSHTKNNTDPDDVVIGVVRIAERLGEDDGEYPKLITTQDMTTQFFPEFSLSVDSPWGTFSYPK